MNTNTIKNLCILRLSAIGDVCQAVASVQAIQRHYPDANFTWVIGKVEARLLEDLPGIRFVEFDKSQGIAAYRQLRQQFEQPFDVLLHMQLSLRANLAAGMIPAKRKIGFDKERSKELHSLVINERIKPQFQPHVLEGFQAFAEALGVPAFRPKWDIPVPQADRAWASQYMRNDKRSLIICPAASKAERNWPVDRLAAIADYAMERDMQVILCGGPAAYEKNLGTEIVRISQAPIINLIGRTTLKQLLALISLVDMVIAPDSGPAHMAVTQGTPVIGLYGHSNPGRTGPYLYPEYVVDVYHQHLELQHPEGRKAPWGTRNKGQHIMNGISVDAVKEKVDQVLKSMA